MERIAAAQSGALFATPPLTHRWPEGAALNGPLRDAILAQVGRTAGAALTNVGGWHSAVGTLEFCGDAGRRLLALMRAMTLEATFRLHASVGQDQPALDWALDAWANVNAPGDFNQMHTHPGATWSGVYYVDAGSDDPAAAAALELADPNPARTNVFFPDVSAANITIAPEPGLMVLFPSYVPHCVLPHRGDRPRISVAFNVRKEPYP